MNACKHLAIRVLWDICDSPRTLFTLPRLFSFLYKSLFLFLTSSLQHLTSLTAWNAKLRVFIRVLRFARYRIRYDIALRCLQSRSVDPATPTGPPGVPVNFGSLSPESRQCSIPRGQVAFQIRFLALLCSRFLRPPGFLAMPGYRLISRRLMIALKLRLF